MFAFERESTSQFAVSRVLIALTRRDTIHLIAVRVAPIFCSWYRIAGLAEQKKMFSIVTYYVKKISRKSSLDTAKPSPAGPSEHVQPIVTGIKQDEDAEDSRCKSERHIQHTNTTKG